MTPQLEKFKRKQNLKSRSYKSYLIGDKETAESRCWLEEHYKNKRSEDDIRFYYLT